MPNHSSKEDSEDVNELAARIIKETTAENNKDRLQQGSHHEDSEERKKNPHAQALGRLGGLGRKSQSFQTDPREAARDCSKSSQSALEEERLGFNFVQFLDVFKLVQFFSVF
jgi:hypothetical protein